MQPKGIKGIVLLGLIALMVMTSFAALALANESDVPPSSEESQDLRRSISITAADSGRSQTITINEANVVGLLELRSFAEGISVDEMTAITANAMAKVRAKRPNLYAEDRAFPLMPGIKAVPELEAGDVLVAFGFAIAADGVPTGYIGIAGNEESVPEVHQSARQWLEEIAKTAGNPGVKDHRDNYINTGWPYLMRGLIIETYQEPYGKIRSIICLYWQERAHDPGYHSFAVSHQFLMEPGVVIWPRFWRRFRNHRGYMWHHWNRGCNTETLMEWYPTVPLTGEQTINVHFSAAKAPAVILGWSYRQPAISLYKHTSVWHRRAGWEKRPNTRATRTSTLVMAPGSYIRARIPGGRLGWWRVKDLEGEGYFRADVGIRGYFPTRRMSHVVDLWVLYRDGEPWRFWHRYEEVKP